MKLVMYILEYLEISDTIIAFLQTRAVRIQADNPIDLEELEKELAVELAPQFRELPKEKLYALLVEFINQCHPED
jgi:hypothetical protein